MKVFEFKDYDHYIEGQRLKQNFQDLWAKPDVIYQIAEYIKNNISNPKFGICHGVRRGEEVEHFLNSFKQLNLPDIDVIGTDICDFDVEEDNGISVIMEKKSIVVGKNELDISKAIIDELDNQLPSIKLN